MRLCKKLLLLVILSALWPTAQAAVESAVVSFVTGTSASDVEYDVTSFTPTAIMCFTAVDGTGTGGKAGTAFMVGWADGTSHRVNTFSDEDAATTTNTQKRQDADFLILHYEDDGTLTSAATLKTFDTDGFTLTYSVATTSVAMNCLVLGGDVATVGMVTFDLATSVSSQEVNGMTGTPDVVLFMGMLQADESVANAYHFNFGWATASDEMGSVSLVAAHSADPSDTEFIFETDEAIQQINSGAIFHEANLTTLDSDGFTLSVTNASSGTRNVYAWGLTGGVWLAGNDTEAASMTTKETTTTGVNPVAALFQMTDATSDGIGSTVMYSLGASDGTNDVAATHSSIDNVETTDASGHNSETMVMVSIDPNGATPTVLSDSSVSSFGTEKFTLSRATDDATDRKFVYLVVGDAPATGNPAAVRRRISEYTPIFLGPALETVQLAQ